MTAILSHETELTHDEVRQQLNRILADGRFVSAERNSRLFRYVVEKTLAGDPAGVKEMVIATEIYDRASTYDPKVDSVVRVEASRLRAKLDNYYRDTGANDPVRITIPKGTYVPRFERIVAPPQTAPEPVNAPVQADIATSMPLPLLPEHSHAARRSPWPAMLVVALSATTVAMWWQSVGVSAAAVPTGAAMGTARSPHPEALVAWQEGNDLLAQDPHAGMSDRGMPETLARALERYEYAVAKDPAFARGWASVAEGYDYASTYKGREPAEDTRRAEAAARRAIALDDKLAKGHAMLALVLFSMKWDFRAAEAEYRRAIELDPRSPYAIVEFADLLRETGRLDEAEAQIRKARALLPKLPVLAWKEAEIQLDRNEPDAAIVTATEALRMNSGYGRAHVTLGTAWEAKGDSEKALTHYRAALAMHRDDRRALPALGNLLGRLGRREEAMAVARQLEDLDSRVRNCAYQVGVVYAGLGDTNRAIEWLERAHRTKQAHVPFMAVDARLKPLREEPRFRAILNKVGLKPV